MATISGKENDAGTSKTDNNKKSKKRTLTMDDKDVVSKKPNNSWTCKKCTLVNSSQVNVCVICGGSKLKSVSTIEELTLRKYEFWVCTHCTLNNSPSTTICGACKLVKEISVQQNNCQAYASTSTTNLSEKHGRNQSNSIGTSSSQSMSNSLTPTVHRVLRSASKHNQSATGEISEVNSSFCLYRLNKRVLLSFVATTIIKILMLLSILNI